MHRSGGQRPLPTGFFPDDAAPARSLSPDEPRPRLCRPIGQNAELPATEDAMPNVSFFGNEFLVPSSTAGDQGDQSVAPLAEGRYVVAWADFSSGDGEIYARRF